MSVDEISEKLLYCTLPLLHADLEVVSLIPDCICFYPKEARRSKRKFTFIWLLQCCYNVAEVSGHNLETCGFRIQCLHYRPVSNHFCSRGGGGGGGKKILDRWFLF